MAICLMNIAKIEKKILCAKLVFKMYKWHLLIYKVIICEECNWIIYSDFNKTCLIFP